MEVLKSALYSLEDLDIIKYHIVRLDKDVIEKDNDGLNILHHAILVNYGEVVRYFLDEGYFAVGPKTGPSYLHLSCLLGHVTITNIVLEYRPGDYYAKLHKDEWSNWRMLETVLEQKLEDSECNVNKLHLTKVKSTLAEARGKLDRFTDENNDSLLPLDIAAIAGHLNTVHLLLSARHSGFAHTKPIECAVKLNCPRALKLLVTEEKQTSADLNEAFQSALKRKEVECTRLLLTNGASVKAAFSILNPYHILYMYSYPFKAPGATSRSHDMDACTSLLMSFDCDVNAQEPLCSYPVYSLLFALVHEKDKFPDTIPSYHMNTLKILLEAGANVNFDEVAHRKVVEDPDVITVGREHVTSSLNAFFVSLQESHTWRIAMDETLEQCCHLLLEYGANPNYIDSYGESPQHDLMKLWATQHTKGNLHADLSGMMYRMLQYGADPNILSTNGLYPVHYYFKILFSLMEGQISVQGWKKLDKARIVLHVLDFMETDNAIDAHKSIIVSCFEAEELAKASQADVADYINGLVSPILCEPKSMQQLCQLRIWDAVGRTKAKLNELPLPKRHIFDLTEMFSILKYC